MIMKMHCLYSCRFSSFFSNRLQEVSNTLINRLTMPNKMVTNVFRSVCFAFGSRQLKSPFCLHRPKLLSHSTLLLGELSLSFFPSISVDRTESKAVAIEMADQRISQCLFVVCFQICFIVFRINIKGLFHMSASKTFYKGWFTWINLMADFQFWCIRSKHRQKLTNHLNFFPFYSPMMTFGSLFYELRI